MSSSTRSGGRPRASRNASCGSQARTGSVPLLTQEGSDQTTHRSVVFEYQHHLAARHGASAPVLLRARVGVGHGLSINPLMRGPRAVSVVRLLLLSQYTLALMTHMAWTAGCNRVHSVDQRLARLASVGSNTDYPCPVPVVSSPPPTVALACQIVVLRSRASHCAAQAAGATLRLKTVFPYSCRAVCLATPSSASTPSTRRSPTNTTTFSRATSPSTTSISAPGL